MFQDIVTHFMGNALVPPYTILLKELSYRSKVAFQNHELRNFAQETLDRASLSNNINIFTYADCLN